MPRPRPQFFSEFRYGPKGVLVPGDRFRVSGGPIYVIDDGKKISMYERGVFVFRRYCIRGAAKWLEAYRSDGGGLAILWVGRSGRSPAVPNLRRRPYRIRGKVRAEPPKPRRRGTKRNP